MANQKEIETTYDYMDEIWRLSFPQYSDITCAMYNGDFTMSLDQAQENKYEYILKGLNFKPEHNILDIGCGWGPILRAISKRHGHCKGITLSPAQASACQANQLDATVQDWKTINPEIFGKFNGIISVGAFEHFCSIEEMEAGQQEKIYDHFFKLCADLLHSGDRLFLQTMIWGKKVPDPKKGDLDVSAPKLSDEWILGLLTKFYPGSWLPNSLEQIVACASPYFKLVSENNGRLDYIQTMKEWGKRVRKLSWKKIIFALKLVPKYIVDKNFRYQVTSMRFSCNRLCFERSIMTHQRMIFEKI